MFSDSNKGGAKTSAYGRARKAAAGTAPRLAPQTLAWSVPHYTHRHTHTHTQFYTLTHTNNHTFLILCHLSVISFRILQRSILCRIFVGFINEYFVYNLCNKLRFKEF